LARTALLSLLPAVLIATGWRQLESPPEGRDLLLAAALGIGVALVPRRRLRLLAGGLALLVAVHLAFGLRPLRGVFSEFGNGVLDFYDVTVPFDPGEHSRMHGVLLLAVFAFTVGAALAIAARRPILAAALTFAGAAWPVTLIRDAPTAARGLLLLVAALLLLAALRPGPRHAAGQTAAVGAAVVLAALVAVSTPAVAKGGFLDWERWEPYSRADKAVGVSYVWDSNYRAIKFPKQSTTVLTIKAPPRAPYWRATTLDVFVDDNWRQDALPLEPVQVLDRDALLNDRLVPEDAWDAGEWFHQQVRVRGLRDTHLVGATNPIAYERGTAVAYSAGVAHVPRLERDQRYEVWSYVRRPNPRDLVKTGAAYPPSIRDGYAFLETPSGFVPAFGTPGRDRLMRLLLAGDFGDQRYRRLYDAALRVTGRPTNPYAAVIALEAWFRSEGNFVYDETPPAWRGLPPLVAFVDRDRRGYCQHFAGAMALMLRYLGIPARVGAGFTTGRYNISRREYTVSDTNAHTWVEVWFPRYGWLPFDPTPGRGRLLSPYTSSSSFFDAGAATRAMAGVGAAALGLQALRERLEQADAQSGGNAADGESAGGQADGGRGTDGGPNAVLLVLLAAAGILAGLWLIKTLRRRARYLTRDPRELATALRLDLVDYLVDQRVPVSPSATPAEVGVEVERSLGIGAFRFAEALGEARYGPEGDARGAVTRATRELRAIRRGLRRRLGMRERLRGLLSLRSLGLGAR
jgi:protein-glutamine gamma-glutamyltransferase